MRRDQFHQLTLDSGERLHLLVADEGQEVSTCAGRLRVLATLAGNALNTSELQDLLSCNNCSAYRHCKDSNIEITDDPSGQVMFYRSRSINRDVEFNPEDANCVKMFHGKGQTDLSPLEQGKFFTGW